MITVYQTDADGFYVPPLSGDPSTADPDPQNDGQWLIPGGCVLDAPPQAGPQQVARWVETAWQLVPDLRDAVYWTPDGVRHTITERGVDLPEGALTQDPGPTAAQLWTARQAQAQAALDASDITLLRCVENAVAVPADWVTYRTALRAIVRAASGDATQSLPTRPAYPAGT